MSHAATNWAITQRGLKPATKIVLWHLADCHNGHTGQCNPRQAVLANRCEMSRSTINVHLAELERRGLVKRHKEIDPTTAKQLPTHYSLSMDGGIPEAGNASEGAGKAVSGNRTQPQDVDEEPQDVVVPSPDSGHGAESGKQQKPSPDLKQSRVRNPDSIENPGIEPGIEPCVSGGEQKKPDVDFKFLADRLLKVHPRPGSREKTEAALRTAIDAGADPEAIIGGARVYAREQAGNKRQYLAYSENWVEKRRWLEHVEKRRATFAEQDAAKANLIKSGKRFLCGSITAAAARALIAEKMVTEQQCRDVGVL